MRVARVARAVRAGHSKCRPLRSVTDRGKQTLTAPTDLDQAGAPEAGCLQRESVLEATPSKASLGPSAGLGRAGRPGHAPGLGFRQRRRAGQVGQLLEGQEGQLEAAAAAMAWTLGQPLKRGKMTAVSSTPVMNEKSIDIRHRLTRETAPVSGRPARPERLRGRGWPRLWAAGGTTRRCTRPPERRLAAKPVPPHLDKRLVAAACAVGSAGPRAGHPTHARAGSPCRPSTCGGTGRLSQPFPRHALAAFSSDRTRTHLCGTEDRSHTEMVRFTRPGLSPRRVTGGLLDAREVPPQQPLKANTTHYGGERGRERKREHNSLPVWRSGSVAASPLQGTTTFRQLSALSCRARGRSASRPAHDARADGGV